MSLHRWDRQRDANEPSICAGLRAVGAQPYQLDRPTDLLVGYRGKNYLLEVKLPEGPKGGKSHSKPNPSQDRFLRTWPGQVDVVRTLEEALHAIGAKRGAPVAREVAPGATIVTSEVSE